MGEDQDAGSPPAAHPAPTAPETATKEEKKAPLSEHHILPETPAPSSLSDDSPSKPKPTLAPEQRTPPPLESEEGDGLVGGKGDGFNGGGSGVEVPGTGLDGVRRDVEKGNLGGRGERSESANLRTEEPGGLALARVEPQVRYT